MPEEKKIEEFRPSGLLYVFLFIYYSIWILQGFGAIHHYWTFGFESFEQYGLSEWLCFPVWLVAAFYSLYAVIKTLRGDADCITALKWSLVIVFLYTGFDQSRGKIATYNIWVWCSVFFARPLFYLIFYLYLCFAKGIKRRYPKVERRFSPSGWVWGGILTAFVAIGVYGGIKQYEISQYCKKVDVAKLNLQRGEISDGYILFNSERGWREWKQPTDTLWIDERIETLPTMESVDSTSMIYLMSGQCYKPDARTHNQIIVSTLGLLRQNEIKGNLQEICFTDTIINGNKLMATAFIVGDSIPAYFTIMNITDSISPKCSVLVRIDKENYDAGWTVRIAKSIRFDLQNIAQSEYDKESDDAKHSQSNGVGYRHNQTDANMLTSLQHSLFPRFFIGVMHPKNREREIAKSECYDVVYYLQKAHIKIQPRSARGSKNQQLSQSYEI